MTKKIRSKDFNDAYWAWLGEVARDMNNQGTTLQDLLEKLTVFEVMPTSKNIHEYLSKNYTKAQFGKESSTQLTNPEMSQLIDALTLFFAHNFDNDIVFDPQMHNLLKHYKE